jgi:hypothetical protein
MTMRIERINSVGPTFLFDSSHSAMNFASTAEMDSETKISFVGREGLKTWDGVKKVSQEAWEEGREVIQRFKEDLLKADIPDIKSRKRRFTLDGEEGDEIDMERLYAGETDFFRSSEREDSEGPGEVTIVIDPSAPWHVDSDNLFWRGAVALALTEILEERGYNVELWVSIKLDEVYVGPKNLKSLSVAARLKQCSDPLDISTLTNTVSGWFFRTAILCLFRACCNHLDGDHALGYGQCSQQTLKDLQVFTNDEYVIHSSGVYSYKGALAMLTAKVEEIAKRDRN